MDIGFCGIYRIINKLNGKSYIGQSRNITERYNEHLYHRGSQIDKEMFDIGKDNFYIEILELCDPNDQKYIDDRERYYISKYNSNNQLYGYNISLGGQFELSGENNPNSKVTKDDVYNIRESYNNHESKMDVYNKYKSRISFGGFDCIWSGKSWKGIHTDVYTEANKVYYSKLTSVGEKGHFSVFTDDEVMNLRKRYMNESAKSIYEDVKNRCSFQTLQCILWGRYYKHIPIYDKKNKSWINI